MDTQFITLPYYFSPRFRVTVPVLYTNVCDVLSASTTTKELRVVLCNFIKRVGTVYGITCI